MFQGFDIVVINIVLFSILNTKLFYFSALYIYIDIDFDDQEYKALICNTIMLGRQLLPSAYSS